MFQIRINLETKSITQILMVFCFLLLSTGTSYTFALQDSDQDFSEYSGVVIDEKTDEALVFASLTIASGSQK